MKARVGWLCAAAAAFAMSAPAGAATPKGDPVAGKGKTAQCSGCHEIPGYRMGYPQVYQVPKLGGQHADYIVSALQEYKNKQRSSTTMQAIAASLNDQDMADLAAYYQGGAK